MRKLKHSKFKNTGILFEMLVRQIASDTLNNTPSKSITILKKYFNKNSSLTKELELYNTLMKEKFNSTNKATQLLSAVVEARSKISNTALNKEKYNLIREIKKYYNLEEFFKATLSDYKAFASIYKVFEYNAADNPVDYVNTKGRLVEYITSKPNQLVVEQSKELVEFTKQDKDVRLLSYKILVDRFNKKYSTLDKAQKSLLREYINSDTTSARLTEYINTEVPNVQKLLRKYINTVDDKIVKIKLQEMISLLNKLTTVKVLKEQHMLTMMRVYELIKELKKV
jgi:hypothetical protein